MRPWRRLVAAILLGTALTAPAALAQRGNPRVEAGGEPVDRMIADFMQGHDVPGMALAIVQAPYITRVVGYGRGDAERGLLVSSGTVFDMQANPAVAVDLPLRAAAAVWLAVQAVSAD